MNDSQKAQTDSQEKRPWHTPSLEELDFSATEGAYIPGAPVDLGMYTV